MAVVFRGQKNRSRFPPPPPPLLSWSEVGGGVEEEEEEEAAAIEGNVIKEKGKYIIS